MPCLATLDDLRRHLGLRPDETADDARLLAVLEAASAELERECARRFEPRLAALTHAGHGGDTLVLADDLLVLTALEDGGGALPLDEVERIPPEGPAAMLRLPSGLFFAPGAVTVTGWWGWHDDPATLWLPSGQSVNDDPLHAASAVLTVSNTAAFSPGQLLRIGGEVARVIGLEPDQNQLLLQRGQQGTAAAAHAQGSQVDVTAPPPDITDLVVRRAAWLALHSDPLPDALRAPARRWRRERV